MLIGLASLPATGRPDSGYDETNDEGLTDEECSDIEEDSHTKKNSCIDNSTKASGNGVADADERPLRKRRRRIPPGHPQALRKRTKQSIIPRKSGHRCRYHLGAQKGFFAFNLPCRTIIHVRLATFLPVVSCSRVPCGIRMKVK